MRGPPSGLRTSLSPPADETVRRHLERLYASVDAPARIAADPIAFPRRYPRKVDAEVAGLIAAQLAYGRVDLFRPVVAAILSLADGAGGPRALAEQLLDGPSPPGLASIKYRWNRGPDFELLFQTLGQVFLRYPDLESLFVEGWEDGAVTIKGSLTHAAATLAALSLETPAAAALGIRSVSDLPRGFRYFLSSPVRGSACKRWNMYLRWMIRPTTEGIDLGLWTGIPPRALVIPLDTHVRRIVRFLGLTARKDDSWRTAEEVTAALRAMDPADPIRYDFAIAHLGISRACLGYRDDDVCPSCPLNPVCTA